MILEWDVKDIVMYNWQFYGKKSDLQCKIWNEDNGLSNIKLINGKNSLKIGLNYKKKCFLEEENWFFSKKNANLRMNFDNLFSNFSVEKDLFFQIENQNKNSFLRIQKTNSENGEKNKKME